MYYIYINIIKSFQNNITISMKSKCIDLNLNYGIVQWHSKILPTLVEKKSVIDLPLL